jgi:hypothetical protein
MKVDVFVKLNLLTRIISRWFKRKNPKNLNSYF